MTRQEAHPPTQVVKVGGSLLELPDLPHRLEDWLACHSERTLIFVVGGGKLADAIRSYDASFRLGDELGHWLCVDLLTQTARILAKLVTDSRYVDRFGDLRAVCSVGAQSRLIFSVAEFLREHEPQLPGAKVTHDWRTTTDSIAARLAAVLEVPLVLLKSCDLPQGYDRQAAAANGLVDEQFPHVAVGPVSWVNLRQLPWREQILV